MISIVGTSSRSFRFPADLPTAYAYYSDASRLLHYLPHISLVREYGQDRFRMLYATTELGSYRVRIYWDVETVLNDQGRAIQVRPLGGLEPVKPSAGLYSTTAHGHFSSESRFFEVGGETRIDYRLELHAELPPPLGLRLMPGVVVEGIARSITRRRLREIVEGFVERSIAAFPHWLGEMETHGRLPDVQNPTRE